MDIQTQFNRVAKDYDQNRRKFIPCFDEFYEGTTAFVAASIAAPKRVLDLGAGTGLLTACWQAHFPQAEYVLVDVAEDMLRQAQVRFADCAKVSRLVLDYTQTFPEGEFDAIVSALSIHHLEDADKAQLFARIHAALPAGGIFVNYDQFCAETPQMSRLFDAHWHAQIAQSGLSEQEQARWQQRKQLDRECSVEREAAMLRQSGFATVQCLYACRKFAVLAAIK